MDNRGIAEKLEQIALLLELRGEVVFKIRAYQNAARMLKGLEEDLEQFVQRANAGEVKGIGKALSEKIEALYRTDELPYLERLIAQFEPGMLELLKVPGLGAKKVRALHEQLGISSLGELEYACHENRLVELKGFGAKSQAAILEGIVRVRRFSRRVRYPTARTAADAMLQTLNSSGLAQRIEVAGSLRRRLETVKDLDLLAASNDPEAMMRAFIEQPEATQIIGHGETMSSLVLQSGIAADLRVVSSEQWPAALIHFTGSKEHNTQLRSRAKGLGFKLNEYGLFRGETPQPLADEADLYAKLGLHYIPPEAREGQGEIELAERSKFPRLVEVSDLRGIVHCHTTFSDGSNTLEAMAHAVLERGYQYLGVSDHSQSASYAGGLKPDDIKRQREEVQRLNSELAPFRILHGIESDILADGSLDYDEALLDSLDFVIASVHSQFNMSFEQMTARIVAAVRNPYTTILGHPTGRLLLSREAYPLDVEAVLEVAAQTGTAIELNANPHRLDLDWRHHRRAKQLGVLIAICPDAHSIKGIDDVAYGVGIARKGWLGPQDVLTCLDLPHLLSLLRAHG
ncbi:MAG: DNA polymerase/3'-5' exonuclease PolX [Candidatus Alcyoniella australis]|nr:DNA polymerase/3'-5' exonuclease PolX [Candidatus Alcyoniella australis]